MASTINAAVDAIVQTADSSGALNIQTSGTTAIAITSAQQVTLTNPLPSGSGGTGISTTPTNGQIDIGNGTGFTRTTLTAGSGISITNGAGSITITNSSTGGAQGYIVGAFGIV